MLQKKIVREVNALVIRCPQKELGCGWEGELGQLQRHLNPGAGVSSNSAEGCEFLTVECAYHCGAQLQRRLIQEHEMEASLVPRPFEGLGTRLDGSMPKATDRNASSEEI